MSQISGQEVTIRQAEYVMWVPFSSHVIYLEINIQRNALQKGSTSTLWLLQPFIRKNYATVDSRGVYSRKSDRLVLPKN